MSVPCKYFPGMIRGYDAAMLSVGGASPCETASGVCT
jgi:hypothetical protein